MKKLTIPPRRQPATARKPRPKPYRNQPDFIPWQPGLVIGIDGGPAVRHALEADARKAGYCTLNYTPSRGDMRKPAKCVLGLRALAERCGVAVLLDTRMVGDADVATGWALRNTRDRLDYVIVADGPDAFLIDQHGTTISLGDTRL